MQMPLSSIAAARASAAAHHFSHLSSFNLFYLSFLFLFQSFLFLPALFADPDTLVSLESKSRNFSKLLLPFYLYYIIPTSIYIMWLTIIICYTRAFILRIKFMKLKYKLSPTAQSSKQFRFAHSHDGIEKLPKNPYSRRHEIPVETSQSKIMTTPSMAPSVQLQQKKLMSRMTSETSRTPVIRAMLSRPFIKMACPGRKIVVLISHGIPSR